MANERTLKVGDRVSVTGFSGVFVVTSTDDNRTAIVAQDGGSPFSLKVEWKDVAFLDEQRAATPPPG
jgi:hypothetical protein